MHLHDDVDGQNDPVPADDKCFLLIQVGCPNVSCSQPQLILLLLITGTGTASVRNPPGMPPPLNMGKDPPKT